MGYFSKLSEQLGEGTGKGINWTIAKAFRGLLALGGAFFVWYFTWKQGEKSFIKANSFRIAVTAAVIAFFTVPGLVRFSFTHPSEESDSQVDVSVQLQSSPSLPGMPDKELFQPVAHAENERFVSSGITYVRYKGRADGKIPHVNAWPGYCIMVTAGEKIVIHSDTSPKDVMNMHPKVTFSPRFNRLSGVGKFLYRNNLAIFGEGLTLNRSWGELAADWSIADVSLKGNGFMVTAANASKIPYPHAGGMVCF